MSSSKSWNTREISDIFHFAAIHFLPERYSAMVLIYIYTVLCEKIVILVVERTWPSRVNIWPSRVNIWPSRVNIWPSRVNIWPSRVNIWPSRVNIWPSRVNIWPSRVNVA